MPQKGLYITRFPRNSKANQIVWPFLVPTNWPKHQLVSLWKQKSILQERKKGVTLLSADLSEKDQVS